MASTTTSGDRHRAQAIATAALRRATALGVTLPPTLRLWSLAADDPRHPDPSGRSPVARTQVMGESPVGFVGSVGAGSEPADEARASAPPPEASLTARPTEEGLASVLEAVTPAEQRQAKGLHVTPGWLADELVELALDELEIPPDELTICDPACGGGAFLLSAARALHSRGVSRSHVVRHLLWGADVDPVGLAAAEVTLALWAGEAPPAEHLVVGDPLLAGRGLWPTGPTSGFAAVVGNPPFLNQLGKATVRPADTSRRLRARFGPAVRAYTDTAWLFLLLGCELVRDGGRLALLQPISLVGARDAAVVRAILGDRATLRHLWVERQRSFAAHVNVCAPVLEVHHPAHAASAPSSGSLVDRVDGRGWADRLADALGIPRVDLAGRPRLGDRAEVLAGFRDEYYGLVPLVREATGHPHERPLVTAGVIDWGRSAWAERPTRFAKRRWAAPVVDLSRLGVGDDSTPRNENDLAEGAGAKEPGAEVAGADAARAKVAGADVAGANGAGAKDARELARDAARWVERTAVPKIVVATQTRVVEAAVDEEGRWVPSVPTLAILPHDPEDLWPLAAALSSPTATAWLLRRAPETGLSRGALKIAARDLAELPLPADTGAWTAATAAFRAYLQEPTPAHLDAFAQAAAAAYRAPPSLTAWWRRRLQSAGGA